MFLQIPNNTKIPITIYRIIFCFVDVSREPVLIYLIMSTTEKYKNRGRKIKKATFCLIAPIKSSLKRQINILEIPHPGQCKPVIKCKGQGIAKPVSRLRIKYKIPTVRKIPTVVNNLLILFFIKFRFAFDLSRIN